MKNKIIAIIGISLLTIGCGKADLSALINEDEIVMGMDYDQVLDILENRNCNLTESRRGIVEFEKKLDEDTRLYISANFLKSSYKLYYISYTYCSYDHERISEFYKDTKRKYFDVLGEKGIRASGSYQWDLDLDSNRIGFRNIKKYGNEDESCFREEYRKGTGS